ncbi:hypothetical protein PMI28_03898 [Pseudomonas sp. GM48]|nr:hypothetical protein PMI28_03898 [Pseudomonas sp. GM48]
MGGSDHHGLSVALSESGALQALLFLSNPSSRCGYYDEKQRHLTRLVRRSSSLIASPLCLKSTRASFAFAIKTSRSRNGNKQPFCFVGRSARSAANGGGHYERAGRFRDGPIAGAGDFGGLVPQRVVTSVATRCGRVLRTSIVVLAGVFRQTRNICARFPPLPTSLSSRAR